MRANQRVRVGRVPHHLSQKSWFKTYETHRNWSFNPRQAVASTHKDLAGLLRKLVESLTLHLEDLHIEGKQVLPEDLDETLKRYVSSPLHSFLSGHGTNKESGIHILGNLWSSQKAIKTESITMQGRLTQSDWGAILLYFRFFTTLNATLGSSVATTSLDM